MNFFRKKYFKNSLCLIIILSLFLQIAPVPAQAISLSDVLSWFTKKIQLPKDLRITEKGDIAIGNWGTFVNCICKKCPNNKIDCSAGDKCKGGECVNPFSHIKFWPDQVDELKDGKLNIPRPEIPEICKLKIPIPSEENFLTEEERESLGKVCSELVKIQRAAANEVYFARKVFNNTDPKSECLFLRNCKSSCYLSFGEISYTVSVIDVAELFLPAGIVNVIRKILNIVKKINEVRNVFNALKESIRSALAFLNTIFGQVAYLSTFWDSLKNIIQVFEEGSFGKIFGDYSENLFNFSRAKSEAQSINSDIKNKTNSLISAFKGLESMEFLYGENSSQKKDFQDIIDSYYPILMTPSQIINRASGSTMDARNILMKVSDDPSEGNAPFDLSCQDTVSTCSPSASTIPDYCSYSCSEGNCNFDCPQRHYDVSYEKNFGENIPIEGDTVTFTFTLDNIPDEPPVCTVICPVGTECDIPCSPLNKLRVTYRRNPEMPAGAYAPFIVPTNREYAEGTLCHSGAGFGKGITCEKQSGSGSYPETFGFHSVSCSEESRLYSSTPVAPGEITISCPGNCDFSCISPVNDWFGNYIGLPNLFPLNLSVKLAQLDYCLTKYNEFSIGFEPHEDIIFEGEKFEIRNKEDYLELALTIIEGEREEGIISSFLGLINSLPEDGEGEKQGWSTTTNLYNIGAADWDDAWEQATSTCNYHSDLYYLDWTQKVKIIEQTDLPSIKERIEAVLSSSADKWVLTQPLITFDLGKLIKSIGDLEDIFRGSEEEGEPYKECADNCLYLCKDIPDSEERAICQEQCLKDECWGGEQKEAVARMRDMETSLTKLKDDFLGLNGIWLEIKNGIYPPSVYVEKILELKGASFLISENTLPACRDKEEKIREIDSDNEDLIAFLSKTDEVLSEIERAVGNYSCPGGGFLSELRCFEEKEGERGGNMFLEENLIMARAIEKLENIASSTESVQTLISELQPSLEIPAMNLNADIGSFDSLLSLDFSNIGASLNYGAEGEIDSFEDFGNNLTENPLHYLEEQFKEIKKLIRESETKSREVDSSLANAKFSPSQFLETCLIRDALISFLGSSPVNSNLPSFCQKGDPINWLRQAQVLKCGEEPVCSFITDPEKREECKRGPRQTWLDCVPGISFLSEEQIENICNSQATNNCNANSEKIIAIHGENADNFSTLIGTFQILDLAVSGDDKIRNGCKSLSLVLETSPDEMEIVCETNRDIPKTFNNPKEIPDSFFKTCFKRDTVISLLQAENLSFSDFCRQDDPVQWLQGQISPESFSSQVSQICGPDPRCPVIGPHQELAASCENIQNTWKRCQQEIDITNFLTNQESEEICAEETGNNCFDWEGLKSLRSDCFYYDILKRAIEDECKRDENCNKIRGYISNLINYCPKTWSGIFPSRLLRDKNPDLGGFQNEQLDEVKMICQTQLTDIKTPLEGIMNVYSFLLGIRSATRFYRGIATSKRDAQKAYESVQALITLIKELPKKFKDTKEDTLISGGFQIKAVKCNSQPAVGYNNQTGPEGGPVCPKIDYLFSIIESNFALMRQGLNNIWILTKEKKWWAPTIEIGRVKIRPSLIASYPNYDNPDNDNLYNEKVGPLYDRAEKIKGKTQILWALATALNFANEKCTCGESFCKPLPLCISGIPLTLSPLTNPYCYLVYLLRHPLLNQANNLAGYLNAEIVEPKEEELEEEGEIICHITNTVPDYCDVDCSDGTCSMSCPSPNGSIFYSHNPSFSSETYLVISDGFPNCSIESKDIGCYKECCPNYKSCNSIPYECNVCPPSSSSMNYPTLSCPTEIECPVFPTGENTSSFTCKPRQCGPFPYNNENVQDYHFSCPEISGEITVSCQR